MPDDDERCHLLGTTRLLNSISSFAADGGFKESASWSSLRQHIYISLTSEQPLALNLDNYHHSQLFADQSDEAWANRIILIFAKILNHVFAEQPKAQRNQEERWHELKTETETWHHTKPWYFSPLWIDRDVQPGHWPEVLLSHPAQVVGLQYYCLCKIVLAIYDPRLTKLGFGSHKLRKSSEDAVVEYLKMAVGLAVSNPDVTNAMFQSSHILAVCGPYLQDTKDQGGCHILSARYAT